MSVDVSLCGIKWLGTIRNWTYFQANLERILATANIGNWQPNIQSDQALNIASSNAFPGTSSCQTMPALENPMIHEEEHIDET